MKKILPILFAGVVSVLMVIEAIAQQATPTPTPRTKQETIVYEEIRFDRDSRITIYIDDETGQFSAVFKYNLKTDKGDTERGRMLVPLSGPTRNKIKEAVLAIQEDANNHLGFKREQR